MQKIDIQKNISDIKNGITRAMIISFVSTFIIGFLVHGYIITNKLPNHDDVGQLVDSMNRPASGRWLLETASNITSNFSMPWLNGVMAFFYIALTAMILTKLFQIKRSISAFLVGAILVSFPAWGAIFPFMSSVDAYALSLLLAVVSVFILINYKYTLLPSIILFAMSLGIYQTFIGFAAGIALLYVLNIVINSDAQISHLSVVKLLIRMFFWLIGGVVLYYIIVKVTAPVLVDYQGISDMGNISFRMFIKSIINSYKQWFTFFFSQEFEFYLRGFRTIHFVLFFIFFLYTIWFLTLKNFTVFKKILFMLIVLLLPLASNLIYVVAPTSYVGLRMISGYTIFYLLFILLYEYGSETISLFNFSGSNKAWNVFAVSKVLVAILISISIYNFTVTTNRAYFHLDIMFKNDYAYINRLLLRIESHKEFDQNSKIYVIGNFMNKSSIRNSVFADDIKKFDLPYSLTQSWTKDLFIQRYFGTDLRPVFLANKSSVLEKISMSDYNSMKNYPYSGSIIAVNGDIYVKASDVK